MNGGWILTTANRDLLERMAKGGNWNDGAFRTGGARWRMVARLIRAGLLVRDENHNVVITANGGAAVASPANQVAEEK